jgi:antitoxin component of MazEF toxin-antitoxin module
MADIYNSRTQLDRKLTRVGTSAGLVIPKFARLWLGVEIGDLLDLDLVKRRDGEKALVFRKKVSVDGNSR